MPQKLDWEGQLGRRFKLRDLHVFFLVVQRGSMAKAAAALGVSQPAISEVIANLERAVGVRLFDRGAQGIEPTIYGRALIRRSIAIFDELKQGVRDIEFLCDPTRGEVRIGCSEAMTAILSTVIERFCERHPRVVMHVNNVQAPFKQELSELRDRKFDLLLSRVEAGSIRHDFFGNDLHVERLFDDRVVVAAGTRSPWAGRRKIALAQLTNEPWILPAPGIWGHARVAEAFQVAGLKMPTINVVTLSVPLRIDLILTGKFVSAVPRSLADRYSLKVLPVELPARPWSVVIVRLKNRTLSPVVDRFIDCCRQAAESLSGTPSRRKAPGKLSVAQGSSPPVTEPQATWIRRGRRGSQAAWKHLSLSPPATDRGRSGC